ncbi:MAG TPA: TraB/GumN family protein [Candidatus Saccharimonadia bacterium]|nr:TraB/GumN family protein [Candidatus Saccharimonadia bacterium]
MNEPTEPTFARSGPAPAPQPQRVVVRDGIEYVLLGTAHVSRASAEAVRALVANERFDAIAVELCAPRAAALLDPAATAAIDLLTVLREGRAAVVGAGLALGAYPRRLAQQFGVEPGGEMKAAIEGARSGGIPYWLVDRDVGITLRRTRAAVGFWDRIRITGGLVASVLDDSEVDEASIERLKQGDVLAGTFAEFAEQSPALYEAIIAERDRYMAARLRQCSAELLSGNLATHGPPVGGASAPTAVSEDGSGLWPLLQSHPVSQPQGESHPRVLAVVGAGHLEGIARHLAGETAAPIDVLAPLRADPPPSKFGKWFGWFLIAFVLGGFAWGFAQGKAVGLEVLGIWVVTTGVLGAVGAAVAGAHPLSILAAFVASPLTPLHPALASGMVSAAVELMVRKPSVGDFELLRDDVGTLRGWWRTRVARVLLVFFLTSLGTAAGVWIAGFQMAAKLAR